MRITRHEPVLCTCGRELLGLLGFGQESGMSSKKKLSCGRDFFSVPNLRVALEQGGQCGYFYVCY